MTTLPPPPSLPSPSPVRDLILRFLAERTPGLEVTAIPDHANLVESQVIDSVGLIDLLLFLETETGHPIDFMAIDPERMMSLAGICALFATGAGAGAGAGAGTEGTMT